MRKKHGVYEDGIVHTDAYKGTGPYVSSMGEKKDPEFEKLVKELKKRKGVDNPWALAHSILNKKHSKNEDGVSFSRQQKFPFSDFDLNYDGFDVSHLLGDIDFAWENSKETVLEQIDELLTDLQNERAKIAGAFNKYSRGIDHKDIAERSEKALKHIDDVMKKIEGKRISLHKEMGIGESMDEAKKSIGDRVVVTHGSGVDSGKKGTIVKSSEVKTDGKGIPTNVKGAYKPVDWTKEVAVKLDGGELITMFKNRLKSDVNEHFERKAMKNEDFGRGSKISSVEDIEAAIKEGPYAWPGGYPIYFITADGAALSFSTVEKEINLIKSAIADKGSDKQWEVVARDINWEDTELYDDHTGKKIESAYGDDEKDEGQDLSKVAGDGCKNYDDSTDQCLDEKKEKWIIKDWAGNIKFKGKTFSSFDDGFEFLSAWVEKTYPDTVDNEDRFHEEIGEFEVVPDTGSRESRYLDPKDPRNGIKANEAKNKWSGDVSAETEEYLRTYQSVHPESYSEAEISAIIDAEEWALAAYWLEQSLPSSEFKKVPKEIQKLTKLVTDASYSRWVEHNVEFEDIDEAKKKETLQSLPGSVSIAEDDEEETQPDDDDIFLAPTGQLGVETSLSAGGKHIANFKSDDHQTADEKAIEAAKAWMKKNNFYPNIWHVSDHGNYHHVILDEATVTLSDADKEKLYIFAKSVPNAVKYVAIPSQDKLDIYYDNVHATEYSIKSILDGNPKKTKAGPGMSNESIGESIASLMGSVAKVEKMLGEELSFKTIYLKHGAKIPADLEKQLGRDIGHVENEKGLEGINIYTQDPKIIKQAIKIIGKDQIAWKHMDIKEEESEETDEAKKKPSKEKSEEDKIVDDLAEKLGEEFKEEIKESLKFPGGRYEGYSNETGSFEADGDEYNFFTSEEIAEQCALEYVKQQIESEPELFSPSFMQQHIYITDTDRRLIGQEEADARAEDYRYDVTKENFDEVFDQIETGKSEYEDLKERMESEEADNDEDAVEEIKSEIEKLAEKSIEEWSSEYSDSVEEQLKDPIQYFVKDQGIYTEEELFKQSFISIDEEAAAKDAVDTDGWAHFLNSYSGNDFEKTDGGIVYFRE